MTTATRRKPSGKGKWVGMITDGTDAEHYERLPAAPDKPGAKPTVDLDALSHAAAVLHAAARIQDRVFTREQLVVAAWTLFPKRFGLKGHEHQYPDANIVMSYVFGERGLVRRGYLRKFGPGRFEYVRLR